MYDLVIRGARRWGAPTADIAIGNGRIAAIGTDLVAAQGTNVIDASGRLVLPGLVDAHAHLDKTLWGTPWHPHQAGPSLMDKITNEREVLGRLGLSPELQSARLLRHMIARGTTHVRTHVDVGPEVGLTQLHGVQAMRERHRDWIDLEIVAFPQTGVMIRPGTLELLEQAAREGPAGRHLRDCRPTWLRHRHPPARPRRSGGGDDRDDCRAHAQPRARRQGGDQPRVLPWHAGAGAAGRIDHAAAGQRHLDHDPRPIRADTVPTTRASSSPWAWRPMAVRR